MPDEQGGTSPEPAITITLDEINAAQGERMLTDEEFEAYCGDLPSDGAG